MPRANIQMGSSPEPDFAAIEAALRSSDSPGEPAEFHGEFCGLACVMGVDAGPAWAASILADTNSVTTGAREILQSLAATTWDVLDAGEMELAKSFTGFARPRTMVSAIEVRA